MPTVSPLFFPLIPTPPPPPKGDAVQNPGLHLCIEEELVDLEIVNFSSSAMLSGSHLCTNVEVSDKRQNSLVLA